MSIIKKPWQVIIGDKMNAFSRWRTVFCTHVHEVTRTDIKINCYGTIELSGKL